MDAEKFVKSVKYFCNLKDIKPTVACRESGAGERLLENVKRGSIPSVEKVQQLAQFLGVTVSELLGETLPDDSIDEDLNPTQHRLLEIFDRGIEKETPSGEGDLSEVKKRILERLNQMSDAEVKKVNELLDVLDPMFKGQ